MASEKIFTPVLKLEHSDARGEIYSIALPDNRELMLLHSKAGALRGGHSHDVDEVVVLLSGKMKYSKIPDLKEHVRHMRQGDVSTNMWGEPHMAEFEEDSWVLEYKFTAPGVAWSNTDYEPWRERVRASSQG